MTRDNKYLTKIVAASLLGDGTINKEENKNGRFKIRQKETHKDHLDFLKERLESITRVVYDYQEAKPVIIMGKDTVQNPAITLRTMAHPFYTKFRERMYGTGRKSIDPHYLTLLDWEFLAIWYMQDGFIDNTRKDCINAQPIICTDNFSYADNMLLRTTMVEKLGITWNVAKKTKNKLGEYTYRLYLYRKDFDKFVTNIYPYLHASYYYKILSNVERRESV